MPLMASAGTVAEGLWLWIAIVILAVLTILAVLAGLAFLFYRPQIANFYSACTADGFRLRASQAEREIWALAASGTSLQAAMDSILLAVEKYLPGRVLSILLYRKESGTLHDGSAPSLPESYRKDVDGLHTGPSIGSCGSAAWHGAAVIAEDIATDFRWTLFRDIAQAHQLHACWSIPIFDSKHELLAILGTYARRAGPPDPAELEFLEVVARAVGVLIERDRALAAAAALEARLREAERRTETGKQHCTNALATVSHELRTPLHGLLGAVDLMRETELTTDQQGYTRLIGDCGEHLLRLVNDLLDLSRIEEGEIRIERVPFRLRDAIDRTCSLIAVQAERKQLVFRTSLDPSVPDVVTGDPERLRQVLTNLLGNAVKFTPAGSVSLEVSSSAAQQSTVELEFVVRDTGLGIRPESQPLLFEPFWRDQATRHHGGTGLGLAISKRLVELMGGSIGVESAEGAGAKFWVRLPLHVPIPSGSPAACPADSDAPLAAASAPNHHLRILAVEDNPVNLLVLERLLARLGHQMTAATTAQEALALSEAQPFDAILVDYQLPDGAGDEVAAAIRARGLHSGGQAVPILALTASNAPEDHARCMASGMNGYLVKPVSLAELADALASIARPSQWTSG